jgi:phenylalanine ammonia-lyase
MADGVEAIAAWPAALRLELRGEGLAIEDVVDVARRRRPVFVTDDATILDRVSQAYDWVQTAACGGALLYGVTTRFGGMADRHLEGEDAYALQNNALRVHKCGAGPPLPSDSVRAAMVARMNSHLRGASGVRLALVRRLEAMLNLSLPPLVPENGSIGASGDLVPLNYIAGAAFGLDDTFKVSVEGRGLGAREALAVHGLSPMTPHPKEALAMINGTSFSAGAAALCVYDFETLIAAAICVHVLAYQALRASDQPLHPFIHQLKGHAGQRWVAAKLLSMLEGSRLARHESNGPREGSQQDLIPDRYAQRCAPQYLGPIVDGFGALRRNVETELNGASDNPLVDATDGSTYHGGNFLAQYIALGMDALRQWLSLLSKHLDVQTAQLMAPEFSRGLPASLVGNQSRPTNMGFKGLQLTSNSLSPLIEFYCAPIADRFPSHAEQYNQNINSQSFNATLLARRQIALARRLVSVSLMVVVQAVDLRSRELCGHCDARAVISPSSASIYEAVRRVVGRPPDPTRPLIHDDDEQWLDAYLAALTADLEEEGALATIARERIGRVGVEPA